MTRRAIVVHRPEVETLSIRLIQVIPPMTTTKPIGRSSPDERSRMVLKSLRPNDASPLASGGLVNRRWTPKTSSPIKYIPKNASVLGRASPFSKTDSPDINLYFLFSASMRASSEDSRVVASVFSSVSGAGESADMSRPLC